MKSLAFLHYGKTFCETYRVIGLASLAECLRCSVDLFNHLSEIFVEFVEPILELLGKFVAVYSLINVSRRS